MEEVPKHIGAKLMGMYGRKCIFVLLVLVLPVGRGIAESSALGQVVGTGIIFSAAEVKKVAEWDAELDMGPRYWVPTAGEITQLESRLLPYLHNEASSGHDRFKRTQVNEIITKFSRYKRQYLGFTSYGKKWILVNGFCADTMDIDKEWREHFVSVSDGGECFFNVRFDPSDLHFEQLEINGDA
jgi:hypothetical protein